MLESSWGKETLIDKDYQCHIFNFVNFLQCGHGVRKKMCDGNGIMVVVKRTYTYLDCECFNLL